MAQIELSLALTGDVMLGRLVDAAMIRDESIPPTAVWGDVLPLLLQADRRLINLECVISRRGSPWRPASKAFHFRASPRAIDVLRAARIDCVTLANNHILDYGRAALLECLSLLDQAGIRHAGAGRALDAALAPAFLETPLGRLAVLSLTDNEPEWEATPTGPGVNYIAYDTRGLLEPYRKRLAGAIEHARAQAAFLVASAHVGPNWGSPSPAIQALARDLIHLGVDLYWGHSNHTPQGIERFEGKTILYSTGDFIDDYAVDPGERNDLSFLFLAHLAADRDETSHVGDPSTGPASAGKPPGVAPSASEIGSRASDIGPRRRPDERQIVLRRLDLHPVAIEHFRVRRASVAEASFLERRMQSKCASFGTEVQFTDRVGYIRGE